MWTGNDHWTITFYVGVLITLLCIALGIFLFFFGKRGQEDWDSYDQGMAKGIKWVGLAFIPITLIVAAIGFFPYKAEYHQYREITGNVSRVDSRLVPAGEGMQEKLVVTYDNGVQVGCYDTRCAGVAEGDTLTLNCKRVWEWFSTPGYDCRFENLER